MLLGYLFSPLGPTCSVSLPCILPYRHFYPCIWCPVSPQFGFVWRPRPPCLATRTPRLPCPHGRPSGLGQGGRVLQGGAARRRCCRLPGVVVPRLSGVVASRRQARQLGGPVRAQRPRGRRGLQSGGRTGGGAGGAASRRSRTAAAKQGTRCMVKMSIR